MAKNFTSLTLLLFFLAGCQSVDGNQQMQQFQASMQNADGCYDELRNREEYRPIVKHMAIKDQPTVEQLADTARPTVEETKLLSKWANDRSVCRKALNSTWGIAGPAYQAVQYESQSKSDAVLVKLIQRKITWGEANKENQQISLTAYGKGLQLDENMRSAQMQADAIDAQRRQAAAAYLIGSGALNRSYAPVYQPVPVSRPATPSIARPITTNCNSMGNNVNCTTY